MSEWMPIETAPKDGQLIVVWAIEPGDYGYTPDTTVVTVARWGYGGWRPTRGGGRYDNGIQPTHWLPLPAPPTAARP